MPARGVKRTASKASASTAPSKNKRKRGVTLELEIPKAPRTRGNVFACGQGDLGQLGLGEDVVETSKFKEISSLKDKIVSVCAGGVHTVALDKDGKVWTFGCNDEGVLGRVTSDETEEGSPGLVALPSKAVKISAGDSHSAALLHDGVVYAWGSFRDSSGSMGLVIQERESKSCREPVKLEINETAVDIASGSDHLVILTSSGGIYTMGCGEQGQLGRLSQRSASRDARQGFSALLVPSKVTMKVGCHRVWAGYYATFALDAVNNKMFAWGLNNYGQLGITGEKRKVAIYFPCECDAFSRLPSDDDGAADGLGSWRCVSAGQHHSLALASNGKVYSIGRCEYGRLGLGDRTGDATELEAVPLLQDLKCTSIGAGTSNSFAVTDSGALYAWGMGSEGQLGTGECEDACQPVRVSLEGDAGARRVLQVSAGGQHAVALAEDPTAPREPTPEPEPETAEQPSETVAKIPERDANKRQRGRRARQIDAEQEREQDSEVSSSSVAQKNAVAEESKPKELNGVKKDVTKMDIDETDTTSKQTDETQQPETIEPVESIEPSITEAQESKTIETSSGNESMDTSSHETVESKSTDKCKDVEMTEAGKTNVNGTPEMDTDDIDSNIAEKTTNVDEKVDRNIAASDKVAGNELKQVEAEKICEETQPQASVVNSA